MHMISLARYRKASFITHLQESESYTIARRRGISGIDAAQIRHLSPKGFFGLGSEISLASRAESFYARRRASCLAVC